MNKTVLASIIVALGLIVSSLFSHSPVVNMPLGGGYEINDATTTPALADGFTQVKSSSAVVGSVVVASSSPTALTLWNATSTTDTASSTVLVFPADTPEGTYTLNSSAPRGLILELTTGFDGNYAVTWR